MSYLEERKELQKEYEELEKMIKAYEYHFKENPSSMRKNWMQPSDEYLKTQLKIEYNYWDTENDSNMLMDYKLKRFRFEEVKSELSKTEKEWEKKDNTKKFQNIYHNMYQEEHMHLVMVAQLYVCGFVL